MNVSDRLQHTTSSCWLWLRTHVVAIAVCIVLTILLFQPEGQQEYVDCVACIILGICTWYLYFFKKQRRTVPPIQLISAGLFALYVIMSCVWTDDIGHTISTLFRYGLLLLTYALWYIYSTKQTLHELLSGILGFSLFASIAAVVVSTNFDFIRQLPYNSLLYSIQGHHPLIVLLLFAYPIAFFRWMETKKPSFLILTIIFFLASVATFSRAGVAIEVIGIWVFIIIQKIRNTQAIPSIIWWIASLVSMLCLLLFIFPYTATNSLTSLFARGIKTSDITLLRSGYISQTLAVVHERPWTGSGLGTFYLESLRFESKAFSFSWLPHCLPFQHLSDLGIVGAGILWLFIGSVIWSIYRRIQRTHETSSYTTLLCGIFPVSFVIVFSLVDIPFLYLIASVIVWSILGALGGVENTNKRKLQPNSVYVLLASIFCVFAYVLYTPTLFFWKEERGPVCNPIRTNKLFVCLQNAITYDEPYSVQYRRVAEMLHPRQRQILVLLAALADRAGETQHTIALCHTTMWYDPFSSLTYYPCWRFFVASKQYPVLGNELAALTLRVFPRQFSDRIRALHLEDASYYPLYEQVIDDTTAPYGYVALLYQLGLASINTDPTRTEQLWQLARDLNPDNGHLHVEYADLLRVVLHRPEEADQVLIDCQRYPLAAVECKEWLKKGTPTPGRLEQAILEGK